MQFAHPLSEINPAANFDPGRRTAVTPYACQSYTHGKPCRYDKRPADAQCAGCPRSSDLDYLAAQGVDWAKLLHARLVNTFIGELVVMASGVHPC
ncbi:hypothetical protein [Uliginosibacterium sp. 31-12]|uniref:hypothetical protein n=1 Tax=Uliginosibacterium sp. 31-12 TaxID=3062781 RepID=UPI0026E17655|nr:hypothetical protein [Uliginosibacterium sp. 31-12]MDO6385592.1 hypothetical protein [Uliginosibacterium sp. 31-12]